MLYGEGYSNPVRTGYTNPTPTLTNARLARTINSGLRKLEIGAFQYPLLRGSGNVFIDCDPDALEMTRLCTPPGNTYVLSCVGRDPIPYPPMSFDRVVMASANIWSEFTADQKLEVAETLYDLLVPGGLFFFLIGSSDMETLRSALRGLTRILHRVFGRDHIEEFSSETRAGIVCQRRWLMDDL